MTFAEKSGQNHAQNNYVIYNLEQFYRNLTAWSRARWDNLLQTRGNYCKHCVDLFGN